MISAEYQALNRGLMASKATWASGGMRHRPVVMELIERFGIKSVLDYGCGRGTLGNAVMGRDKHNPPAPVVWHDYDPSIPGKDKITVKHVDLIVSTHVLEHVEPHLLDATLAELAALTPVALYIAVPSTAAGDCLPDGRNAHLIQEPPQWWREKLSVLGDVEVMEQSYRHNGDARDETRFVIVT